MRLTLLGVGEAFAPEPNSAALLEAAGFTLLIDCGHATPPALWRARPDPDAVDAIYLTHHHADHVLGLVPVFESWTVKRRTRPLTLYTTGPGINHLHRLFAAMKVEPTFPLTYADTAETAAIGPFAVRLAPTIHAAPNNAIRLEHAGRRLAWSGDGRPTPAALALYAAADLLMHECYFPGPDPADFHCDLPTVRAIEGPARIGLYHVRDGDRPALRQAVAAEPRLFVAEAGEVLEI